MTLYVIDTIVTVRMRYVVEAKSLEHAYDEITMKDSGDPKDYFEEVSQMELGETIVSGREIDLNDFHNMLDDLKVGVEKYENSSYWLGEDLIRRINYEETR